MIIDEQHGIADTRRELKDEYYPRSGHIAVMMGFITTQQLKEAITEQIDDDLSNRPHRFIGEILLDRGWITREQIDIILDELYKEEMKMRGKL